MRGIKHEAPTSTFKWHPPWPRPEADVLDEETARGLLEAYHESTADHDGVPTPLMILHGLREEITIRPHIELPSAYHMAHYLHEFVGEKTIGITVCGRFYKQIGDTVFQGTILYHVDRIGSHLVRGINGKTGHYTVLDDSPYWNKFPYDFDEGPLDPDLPIGFHPGKDDEGVEAKAGEGGAGGASHGGKDKAKRSKRPSPPKGDDDEKGEGQP